MADAVLCSLADGVATVTLNPPAKRNALNRAVVAGLEADRDVRDTHLPGRVRIR